MALFIGPALQGLAAVVRITHDILDKKKHARESHALDQRLADMETADLEQTQLIAQLSEHVEQLAKAVEAEMENTRVREAQMKRIIYVALGVAVASLVLSVITFFR
jgi:uncharacterized protein (DUF3084 family)